MNVNASTIVQGLAVWSQLRLPRRSALWTVVAMSLAQPTAADAVLFDDTWREQGFLSLWSNDYRTAGRQLDVFSDGTVSLLWRPVDLEDRGARKASWLWRVTQGVGPTDLDRKGGDDRNISIYFIFVDESSAASVTVRSARRLLRNPAAHALVYVWGGAHDRRSILESPYHPRLRTVIQRTGTLGVFSEQVDLQRDYRAAFGKEAGVLIGLAVSADSDDTDGQIRAAIADLSLE